MVSVPVEAGAAAGALGDLVRRVGDRYLITPGLASRQARRWSAGSRT
jgi:hypothetical protein